MNGQTLQALRGFLFFSVPEAARMIAQVQERTWRYWEAERHNIPNDVANTMTDLVRVHQSMLRNAENQISTMAASDIVLTYYATLDEWMTQHLAEPVHWRVHCSVMATLAAKHNAHLVKFNAVEYQSWLKGQVDTPAKRAEWAVLSR